jgi:hypothetical protein
MKPLGWSHDGRSIYVVGPENPAGLLSMNAETGESRLLMKLPVGIIGDGVASRDGRTLVVSVRERQGDAWLVDLAPRSAR